MRLRQPRVECRWHPGQWAEGFSWRSCPRLQFDVRIGNVDKQIGKCDDEVEVGCQCASWEREGGGRGDDVKNNTTTNGQCTSLKASAAHVCACCQLGGAAQIYCTCA